MVEVGGRPILWHIMNMYVSHGFRDFVIASGYKGEIIQGYFDKLSDTRLNGRIAVVETGLNTMTGGRILRLHPHLGTATFMVTYGDGVGTIDIRALVAFHKRHGKIATVTAVHPPSRFGGLVLRGETVSQFLEKPQMTEGWINGGFFVFEPQIFDYLKDDDSILEREPLSTLASEGNLMAFRHEGFWQPMDTLREKDLLDSLWTSGRAPWKVWT